MNRRRSAMVACLSSTLILGLVGIEQGRAQAPKTAYPNMAPLDQYLMPDRNAEIALARSAAPDAISGDAKILVLGRHGYETAVEGRNGFVCVVERAWMSPLQTSGAIESSAFWNPKIRGPLCFNPQAVRSILPITYKRTEVVLAGKSKAQIMEWTKEAYAKKELPVLEPGAMSYMMSKGACLTDGGGNLAHLMFYVPLMDRADWGADVPNSPVILGQKGPPEPFSLFIVRVGKWSDGTP